MISNIYEILIHGNKVAECYELEVAAIIAKAILEDNYKEKQIEVTIRRIEDE